MTTFLFLQRFENGQPVSVPFAKAVALLERYGKAGRGRGDLEFTFEPGTIASGCTVVGSQEAGVTCIGFERPLYDQGLRGVVWDCMRALDCTAFNDTLDSVYTLPGRARALPPAWGAPTPGIARQTTTPEQLWPFELEPVVEYAPVPAARYPNPNPSGPNLQVFDSAQSSPQALTIELGMRPAACNPGTLRVLRNLELRVAVAIRTNPEYALFYRFTHHETSLLFLESPRLIQEPLAATLFTTPPDFAPKVKEDNFFAKRETFAGANKSAEKFVELARSQYRTALDGSFESIEALSKLLDAVHELDKQERAAPPTGGYAAKTAMNVSVLGGAYLGNILRQFVGGQWGYVTRPDSRRRPAIRMHNGQIRYPHLQIIDHIINGRSDDVAAWARAVAAADRSATPRDEDIVDNILLFCNILQGHNSFADGGLPLEEHIPRAELNFSLDSLHQLDAYIARVAARAAKLSEHAISNLFFVAGAYFGEVVRSNTPDLTCWTWVNYDDYIKANPEFAQKRPRQMEFRAFLDSPTQTAYPFAHIAGLLKGAKIAPSHVYATQLIGQAAAPPATAPTNPTHAAPAKESTATQPRVQTGARSAAAAGAPTAENGAMKLALANVRESLAKWRRLATPSDYLGLRAVGPSWVKAHPLNEVVTQQPLLLEKGDIVWAALLQANNALFKPGPDDHPGAMLYSSDPYFEARPHELRAMAHGLFSYKGTEAPEALRPISDWLTNERQTALNIPVPPSVTDRTVFATSVLFFRKHLPEQHLLGTWMPLLVHSGTRAAMVVPRHFWPGELITQWKARRLDVTH